MATKSKDIDVEIATAEEDRRDREIARARQQEIKENPDMLVTGEALKARLNGLLD